MRTLTGTVKIDLNVQPCPTRRGGRAGFIKPLTTDLAKGVLAMQMFDARPVSLTLVGSRAPPVLQGFCLRGERQKHAGAQVPRFPM